MRRILLSLTPCLVLFAPACERNQDAPPEASTTAPAPAAAPAAKPAPAAEPATKPALEAGQRLDGATSVAVADLAARTGELAGTPIKVTGTVKNVCQHRGCWVEIADGEATILAKSLAHDVLLPKDAAGKRIEIEGTLRVDNAKSSCDHGAGDDHGDHGDHGEEGHSCPSPETLIEMQYVALFAAP
jgi:hypothetical protein